MEFLRIRGFGRRGRKKEATPVAEESVGKVEGEVDGGDVVIQEDQEDDDDLITEEVRRRLKELRKGSFMVLIPEEECLEDEEGVEGGSSSSEWREEEDVETCGWCGFDAFYEDYCERMAFFDRMANRLLEAGSRSPVQSPHSISKKMATSLLHLSFKRKLEQDYIAQHLELQQPVNNPHESLESVYVAQICLSWEALTCQYKQLSHQISSRCENSCCYSYACQAFQQFQVLVQRYIENEPFEDGSRVETYARARKRFPLLLQIPRYQGLLLKEEHTDGYKMLTPATDLLKIMEDSILTFHNFLKIEKNSQLSQLFGGQKRTGGMLHLLHNSIKKKEIKLKELYKRRTQKKECSLRMEEFEILSALIDVKIIARVLRMDQITKQQLLWCEQKMSKLDISDNRLHCHGFPVIFPC